MQVQITKMWNFSLHNGFPYDPIFVTAVFLFSRYNFDGICVVYRIGFSSHNGSIHFDWTLGAFIYQSMLEPSESEFENQDQIVGDESLTYLLLVAVLLIAFLTAYFVRQWRKPQIKTVYDLEKGRYIITRLPG